MKPINKQLTTVQSGHAFETIGKIGHQTGNINK